MKHEIRNSKSETNSNDKNPKFKKFWSFENLNFDIVSDFDIRISDLYEM
jgi:peroxiredoxin